MRSLKCDLNKTLLNTGFLFATLLTTVLCFTASAYTDDTTDKTYSVFEAIFSIDRDLIQSDYRFSSFVLFGNGLTGYASMFLPIIVAFPFMVSFCSERNSGLMRFTITRTGKLRYYLSKFLASFLCGGLATALGLALYGIMMWIIFPSLSSYNVSSDELQYILTSSMGVSILKVLLSAFLYGAFSTVPAFLLSSFCKNPYLITCIPFMLVYIWNTAINKIIAKSYETGDYDIYGRIAPFYPNSVSNLVYATEFNRTTKITLIFNVCYLLVGLIGFMVIMNLRTDKGA